MRRPAWLDRHRHHDADLDEEIRAHLEEKVDAFMASGMSKQDAIATAKREFGNVSVITEQSRDVWRWPWLEALRMDARHALRLIRRYPAFSTNVVFISAVGIAACAATFSLVNGVLFSPLPFANPDQLFEVELHSTEGENFAALSVDSYLQIAAGSPVIEDVATYGLKEVTVHWGNEPDRLQLKRITPSFFPVFGVTPQRGRAFNNDDAEHDAPVMLIGNALWHSRFHADTTVIGSSIVLDSVPYTIVGIMPPEFRAHFNLEPDAWIPLRVSHASGAERSSIVTPYVRIRRGVTPARAESWLSTVVHDRMESRSSRDSVSAKPVLIPIRELVYGNVEQPLHILLGAVILVLALIVANVATMFLARSSARDHELGVRRALGASTSRQVRQLITEAVVLVAIGGGVGLLGSFWIVAAVRTLGERILPRMDAVHFDWRVAVFAVVATLLTGVLGGLPPALAARRDLKSSAGGVRVTGRRTSSALVVAQISLSVMLLVGAGLLVKGFLRVLPSKPGFATENRTALMVTLNEPPKANKADSNAARRFVSDVSERMRRLPGVRDVAAMSFPPFLGVASSDGVELIGYPPRAKPYTAYQNFVTPNLFDVLEIPITRGRKFNDGDVAGAERVAIVSETAAVKWWPGENPIGKRIVGQENLATTIVGVMGDTRFLGNDTRIRAQLYLPIAQNDSRWTTFIVHTQSNASGNLHDLKAAIWSVAPELPVGSSGSLESYGLNSVRRPRFFAWAMGVFAVVAVVLSAVAVYGLLTLDVVQRRQEIGVRMALGASGTRIGALVLRRAAWLGVAGVSIGVISARAFSHYMESLLVEVKATDAGVFATTAALALLVASVAACAPAYRAVRVDPARCLRGE